MTRTSNSGSGRVIGVGEARYFTDGFEVIAGDLIKVGVNNPVRITEVDYGANTLTVDQNISWSKGDGVSYPYSGSAPDMGAYSSDNNPPDPPTGLKRIEGI
jgi:hypothetical protein